MRRPRLGRALLAALIPALLLLQAAAPASASTWWQPTNTGPNNGPEWQWELSHPLNVNNPSDMGIGRINMAGQVAPSPTVFDIDGIENPASTVTALHALGYKAVCYIEVGAVGDYYTAAQEGIPTTYYAQLVADNALANKEPGYNEWYLKINWASVQTILKAMIQQQCSAKGFDAVEPDIDDSYTDATGWPAITEAANETFDRTLGAYAHSLGMAWIQKNGDNDLAFSTALQPTTDMLLDEECNFYATCSLVNPPYVNANKLVMNAEYTDDWGTSTHTDLTKFCPTDIPGKVDGVLFHSDLAGHGWTCQ